MEHLVTTTFYDGPRRVPCLRDRGHGIGMVGEERRGKRRKKEEERSRGTFGTEARRQKTRVRGLLSPAVPSIISRSKRDFPPYVENISPDKRFVCPFYSRIADIKKLKVGG